MTMKSASETEDIRSIWQTTFNPCLDRHFLRTMSLVPVIHLQDIQVCPRF
jgi:hypothetical protein